MDLFVTNMKVLASQGVNWTGVVCIMFGLSFWRHPFTAEDPLMSKWCNATFSVSCSRAPQSWYWRWREQLGVRCLAQGHISRGIEGGESSWGFGVLLKGTSVVVLKVERAVGGSVPCSRAPRSWYWRWREQLGGSVPCSRAPQSWYWRWREQLGVRCLAQGHLSRGIEGGESSWGFGVLLKGTSVVVLKVERAVGGSVPCSRAPQSWYWRWREQLGVRCLAQGHLSRGIEGGESAVHSLPPHLQFPPARDSNPQPFDYKSNSLPLNHDFHEPHWTTNCSFKWKYCK